MSDHTRLWNSTWMKGEVDLIHPFAPWPIETVPVETVAERLAREFLDSGAFVVDRTPGFALYGDGRVAW